MIQFPPKLIPNYIQMVAMPSKPYAKAEGKNGLTRQSLQLSDVNANGRLKLVFLNHSVKPVSIAGYGAAGNGIDNECLFEQDGWIEAWKFFDNTLQSGHLCFEIAATHRCWRAIDYYPEWLTSSLSGGLGIWEMANQPVIQQENKPKQICDFSIEIRHLLRSPAWA